MPTKRIENAPTKRNPKLVFALQMACNALGVPSRRKLRLWAAAALRRNAHVTVRIVGAREGRMLNKMFRNRDYATNVLTFVYEQGRPLSGDIALCAPVVAREARSQAKPLDAHYAHLLVHGLLHLQGHDHEKQDEAEAMEAKEITILKKLGFPNPYQSTTA